MITSKPQQCPKCDEAVAALRKYGQHDADCRCSAWDFDEPCTCGFTAALAKLEGRK